MPTILHRPFPLDWRGKPPHMLAPDIPVWYRFLEKKLFDFQALYYDCLLGAPTLTEEQELDPIKRMWRFNTSKRADVIAITPLSLLIIEVADDPGLRAIGQLQVYRTLWLQDPVILLPERLILVCERIDPHLLSATQQYGMETYVV